MNDHEQNAARNVDGQGRSGEVLDGSEEHVPGPWSRGDPWYQVENNLAELCSCSSVSWKV